MRVASTLLLAASCPRLPPPTMQVSSGVATLPTPADLVARLLSPEARALRRELATLALEQDPRVVVRRNLDLARALNKVGTETAERVAAGERLDATYAPRLLRRMCEELGATYVKLGQFVASSPTLFPPEYVAEFQQCLDATPAVAWRDVKQIIESELGKPIGQVYSRVEQTPLASASIAQVRVSRLIMII